MSVSEKDAIVITTPYVKRYKIVKTLSICLGITVRSRGLGGIAREK
ncbi:MAG: hypothetical protein ACP5I6_04200 [Caldisphaera sp.]|jgi:uncharacterized protein YbjQ (UPF0145 family)